MRRNQLSIRNRPISDTARARGNTLLEVNQCFRGPVTQLGGLRRCEASPIQHTLHHVPPALEGVAVEQPSALLDDLMQQATCPRHNR